MNLQPCLGGIFGGDAFLNEGVPALVTEAVPAVKGMGSFTHTQARDGAGRARGWGSAGPALCSVAAPALPKERNPCQKGFVSTDRSTEHSSH